MEHKFFPQLIVEVGGRGGAGSMAVTRGRGMAQLMLLTVLMTRREISASS